MRGYIHGLAASEIHHVEVETASILQDLDTPEDYRNQLSAEVIQMSDALEGANRAAKLLSPGDGKPLSFVGVSTVLKVVSEDTGGAWSLIESTVEPHFAGFKLHRHRRMTEAFYILEGALAVQLGEQTLTAVPGTLVFVPPGTWHTYANPGDRPVRYLLFMSPGGFEKYLEGLAEMIRAEPVWPPTDTGKLDVLAEKYDATAP